MSVLRVNQHGRNDAFTAIRVESEAFRDSSVSDVFLWKFGDALGRASQSYSGECSHGLIILRFLYTINDVRLQGLPKKASVRVCAWCLISGSNMLL